jgi:hypothetical protein
MRGLTKREWFIVFLTALLGGSLACITNTTPPPAPCSIETLLIDENVVPTAWKFNMAGVPAKRFGVEFETVYFVSEYGGGIQDVYREWSERAADKAYREMVATNFGERAALAAWTVPSGLTYQSSIANQAQLGCTTDVVRRSRHCQYIGLYGPYVVLFLADMSEVMTYADFEFVLQSIDQRMSDCLAP